MRRLFAKVFLVLLLALPAQASEPLNVVTTTGMIADAAREVGGQHVEVRSLMGPGVDPHSYRQTRTDIVALTRADVVLWHGLYLEAQMEELLLDLEARQPVFAVAEGLSQGRLLPYEGANDRWDPHVWMDPTLWADVVDAVRDALSEVRPEAASEFTANAAAYREKLVELDAYSRRVTATVPESARVLVTAHDAFSYFGRTYGFDVEGIQGISTESEAGLARFAELVDLIVERGVQAVFVESTVPERNVRALVEGAAAQEHEVSVGGELFSDAMGQSGTYEGTYLGMIDHNVTVIVDALGGDVPARGMSGQLETGS